MVSLVPIISISQKRSKKTNEIKEKTELKKDERSVFMIIKGIEIPINNESEDFQESMDLRETQMKQFIKPDTKFLLMYDFGTSVSKEQKDLISKSRNLRSMSEAVNASAKYGWKFINSNVIINGSITTHYFYMKR